MYSWELLAKLLWKEPNYVIQGFSMPHSNTNYLDIVIYVILNFKGTTTKEGYKINKKITNFGEIRYDAIDVATRLLKMNPTFFSLTDYGLRSKIPINFLPSRNYYIRKLDFSENIKILYNAGLYSESLKKRLCFIDSKYIGVLKYPTLKTFCLNIAINSKKTNKILIKNNFALIKNQLVFSYDPQYYFVTESNF